MRRLLLYAFVWATAVAFSALCVFFIFGIVSVPIIPHNLAEALDTFLGLAFSSVFVAFLVLLGVSFTKQIEGSKKE